MSRRLELLSPSTRLLVLALGTATVAAACGGEVGSLPQYWTDDQLAPDLPESLPADEGQSAPETRGPESSTVDVRAGGPTLRAPGLSVLAPRVPTLKPWIAEAAPTAVPAVDTSAPAPVPGLDEGAVCTFTAAEFGAPCGTDSAAVGCLLRDHFADLFGSEGLEVGGVKSVRLTSAGALAEALPGGLDAAVLVSDQVDPDATETNTLTSQVVALAANLAIAEVGLGGSESLAELRLAHGPLTGMSVGQLFDMSQALLAGEPGTLGALGYTPDLLVPVLDRINRAGQGCAATVMLTR